MSFIRKCTNLVLLASIPYLVSAAPNLQLNPAEKTFLSKGQYALQYANEKLPIITVDNTFELGKLAALSFIDWASKNPEGVIALPSGKTPEYFIKFLAHYKNNWHQDDIQHELREHGIQLNNFPQTSNLKFVQLDEFYGLPHNHQRSFNHYVKQFYLKHLDIKPENTLLIDLANLGTLKENGYEKLFPSGKADLQLLKNEPASRLEHLQKQALLEATQYCQAYEETIRNWGGIGFFLGGIGLDGHIAFNLPGVDENASTHLTQLNYETSAQSASDLGGIDRARHRIVMTMGLGTLKINPNAKIIIMAAGDIKAPIIRAAIEQPATNHVPASLLQHFNHPIFYLTKGAQSQLSARMAQDIRTSEQPTLLFETVIRASLEKKKPIKALDYMDFKDHLQGQALLEKVPSLHLLLQQVSDSIEKKIEAGLRFTAMRTLHTAPHHDDVMLSYYPLMRKILASDQNHFAYLTSGFNAVTDDYILQSIRQMQQMSTAQLQKDIFETDYQSLLTNFRHAVQAYAQADVDSLEPIFVYHKMKDSFDIKNLASFSKVAKDIEKNLLEKTPGNSDTPSIQRLKGEIRETEADRLWALNQVSPDHIHHMRSKFYTGAIFDPLPNLAQDTKPMMDLLHQVQPELVTVALDPEGTGPDTHYKVLQVVAQSLIHSPDLSPTVWGYRNVWHRFDYSDANLFYPVQYKELHGQHEAFMQAFSTQKTAAFPSHQHDGPFSEISVKLQAKQLQELRTLLGDDYFDHHANALLRNASGFVLIKQMPKQDFIVYADDLKKKTQLQVNLA